MREESERGVDGRENERERDCIYILLFRIFASKLFSMKSII
jgi:hypothetical protein